MISKKQATRYKKQKGQTMILTIIILTGAILSATSISALLVLFQLRQTSDIKASTQAIYAADAGVECILFETVVNGASALETTERCKSSDLLDDAASYTVTYDETNASFKSIGRTGRAARSFGLSF